jgi:hypothetical protein
MSSQDPVSPDKSDPNPKMEGASKNDFRIDIDPKVGEKIQEGLQGGVDMIQSLFTGFVKSIQDAMGPDMLKNVSAGQWLLQVASSLDEVCDAWRVGQPTPAGKTGELACYVERLEEEIQGSRVANQLTALRDRLNSAIAALDQASPESQSSSLRLLSDTVGYIQATAKSAMPVSMGDKK